VNVGDLFRQFGVTDRAGTRLGSPAGIEGGPGDLQQLTRSFDAVTCTLLRLDERVHRHRVSFAKKAVARLRMSTS
jgi:hypothetical protein